MTIQHTVAVPANHRIFLDLPKTVAAGTAAKIEISFEAAAPETMRLSEHALARDWDTPEEDAAWITL